MNRFTSFRLAAALALAALLPWAASAVADRDKDDQDLIKNVHGKIVEVHPDQHQLTVRTHGDKEMTFDVDDHALLEMNGKETRLGQFKEGERVKIRYKSKEGKYRALLVRTNSLMGEELRRKFHDTLDTAKKFGAEQKQQFEQKLQSALHQLDDQIDELKDKAAAQGQAKEQYEKEIRDLERQRDDAQRKLERVKAASGTAWEEIKGGMSSAANDLQKAIDRARSRFKD